MIIVKLKGGLGNQLFQYAAARCLAQQLGLPLKLDLAFLQEHASDRTKREYELNKFQIQAPIATPQEVDSVRRQASIGCLFRIQNIRERQFPLVKRLLKPGRSYYMNGYWQSEKYFLPIARLIRSEFCVGLPPLSDTGFAALEQQIMASNAVSIHFRRGDYVSDAKTNKHHGVCSPDYYRQAVEYIATQVPNPVFFLFSDDIAWVKAHFHCPFPTHYVDKNDEQLLSDFRLMALCKHNIIANSSYSWWAAWLNANPAKIVVAPRRWYRSRWARRKAKDRVPKGWIRL